MNLTRKPPLPATKLKRSLQMLHNRFNPLRSQHEDTPPANPGTATPAPDAAPEKDAADEEKKDEDPDPEPEPEIDPAAPAEAAATPGKLNAFQRTALRALGTGDLIARVERAETAELVAKGEVTRLTSENLRLTGELTKLKAETPVKIAAAQKVREKDVSTGVLNELGKLGVTAEQAPSQISAETADKTKSRAEFNALSVKDRGEFMSSGGKLTD